MSNETTVIFEVVLSGEDRDVPIMGEADVVVRDKTVKIVERRRGSRWISGLHLWGNGPVSGYRRTAPKDNLDFSKAAAKKRFLGEVEGRIVEFEEELARLRKIRAAAAELPE